MSQRAPSLVNGTHYCVVGDVTIDATAAIAPGVVLQAPTGSRIVVGKSVCLAAGVCIQSRQGVLTIAAGASLGANVLVVGSGTVGTNACISAGSTLIDPAIAAESIVPPDSLINTQTATAPTHTAPANSTSANTFVTPEPFNYGGGYSAPANGVQSNYQNSQQNSQNQNAQNGQANGSSSLSVRATNSKVYGRDQVSQLISALFPSRQPLDGSVPNNSANSTFQDNTFQDSTFQG
jgi:carbon dioxide concentrating mechanism protein CcmN